MTATVVNLTDGNPIDVEGWQLVGTKAESMSTFVRQMRSNRKAHTVDALAERRVWGQGVFATLAFQGHTSERTVAYVGEKRIMRVGWDRIIWTNEPPYHNYGRVFIGREELEDA